MIHRILGTINKRIDVGYNTSTGNVFVISSSNCLELTSLELDALLWVLAIINSHPMEDIENDLSSKRILMWEPRTPPAEVRVL